MDHGGPGSCCFSVLQCVAVCCIVLQCVAVCCRVLQSVAVCRSESQCVAVRGTALQCVIVSFHIYIQVSFHIYRSLFAVSKAHHSSRVFLVCILTPSGRIGSGVVAACCSMLQHVAACCNVLQRVAACCTVLQFVSSHPTAVLAQVRARVLCSYCSVL